MAGYIESNLTSNEQIVLKAKVSLWSQWVMISLGILFTLSSVGKDAGGLIVIAFIFFGIAIVRVIITELALTNKRVMAKYGFIRRDSVELRLEKVEGLYVNQSIVGRILNYGTITVSGTGGLKTPIRFISNPIYFRNVFNEFLEHPQNLIDNKQ